jgi:hypothetical protein
LEMVVGRRWGRSIEVHVSRRLKHVIQKSFIKIYGTCSWLQCPTRGKYTRK